jgi:hypothetical protein
MANQLKMATLDSIQTLHERGWSIRRIARALGLHRDTVARHLRPANQAGAPTGSLPTPGDQGGADGEAAKLRQAPTGSEGGAAVEADPAASSRLSRQPSLQRECQPRPARAAVEQDWQALSLRADSHG